MYDFKELCTVYNYVHVMAILASCTVEVRRGQVAIKESCGQLELG